MKLGKAIIEKLFVAYSLCMAHYFIAGSQSTFLSNKCLQSLTQHCIFYGIRMILPVILRALSQHAPWRHRLKYKQMFFLVEKISSDTEKLGSTGKLRAICF